MIKLIVEITINDYEETKDLKDIVNIDDMISVDTDIPYSILTWKVKNINIE